MKSFIKISKDSDFTIYNIPFGVFKKDNQNSVCTRLGDTVINLNLCQKIGAFDGFHLPEGIFSTNTLNDFIRLGKAVTVPVRLRIQEMLLEGGILERAYFEGSDIFIEAGKVDMILPLSIGDYTDFYSSKEHATNVGIMFRDPENALLPNWLHLPVGYHGRASSIVVSGTDIKRPHGQIMPIGADRPIFGQTHQLDFELEMAFVIGKDTQLGDVIPIEKAEDYIFGLMLFNDWSARDLQRWEYVPLGPFLGKNFGSTVSPWVVTLEALEPFRVDGPVQQTEVLPYLKYEGKKSYDIELRVDLVNTHGKGKTISKSNFKYMYWNMCQQLTHHTVNGCNIRVGDVMASGTISGPTPDSLGSLLELSWKGTIPIQMPDGTERKFILDGDSIILNGHAQKGEIGIGFGECAGKIITE
jgi:fumarylacetoacetase